MTQRTNDTSRTQIAPRKLKLTRLTLRDLDARKEVRGGAPPPLSNGKDRCSQTSL